MSETLTKKQAIEYLRLDGKTFDNYFKNAEEFHCLKRRGRSRYLFNKEELKNWKADYQRRTIILTIKDYILCLDFMLAMHFRGYVSVDWGTARQREFGQRLTNWIKGQLAEIAVKKYLKKEFNLDVELDFQIRDKIVPQDIIGVKKHGRMIPPKIKISIKSTKPRNAYLVLGENEVKRTQRKSDVYVLCRPNMPDDHLLRLTKDRIIKLVKKQPHYNDYKDKILGFENMTCEIAGFCSIKELERVRSIPGQKFDGIRYVKKSGHLHRQKKDWEALLRRL